MTGSKTIRWSIAVPQRFLAEPVDIGAVREFITRAETLGYDSLWVIEPTPSQTHGLDPLSLLSYMAALTTRVGIGVTVLNAPLHNPIRLASTFASLDVMSKGRLTVGVGLGTASKEEVNFLPLGTMLNRRVRRFTECVEIMKALWTEPSVTYHGEFWRLDEVTIAPQPLQTPYPPIWFGGRHPNVLKRAALHADGWTGSSTNTLAFKKDVELLKRHLDEVGRDHSSFTINQKIFVLVYNDKRAGQLKVNDWFLNVINRGGEESQRGVLLGTAEEVIKHLVEQKELGADIITVNVVLGVRESIEQMELLAKEVIPFV